MLAQSFELEADGKGLDRLDWNLEMMVFEDRGNSEYPEWNLLEQGREPTTNSTHRWNRVSKVSLCCNAILAPFHTNALSFENPYFLVRFRLSSTLKYPAKTATKRETFKNAPFLVWTGEIGDFWNSQSDVKSVPYHRFRSSRNRSIYPRWRMVLWC